MQSSITELEHISQKSSASDNVLSSEQYWKKRLSQLPRDKQEYIAKKYYGGKCPWKG